MKRILFILTFLTLIPRPDLSALTISVYHTSDVHGWYSARPARWDKENSTRAIGGFAALSSLVNRGKNPYILLDSGDTFQGTPEGSLTRGVASVTLMNQLGYSAAVAGNHEYDYNEDNFKLMLSGSSFPWLGANVYVKETGKEPSYLKPYTIIQKAGKKIAVIGLSGRHTATSTFPLYVKHLEFRDENREAAKWTKEVKKLNPDAIIILTHLGFGAGVGPKTDISTWTFTSDDTSSYGTLAIARAAKGANVVIGGHNHVGLLKGYYDSQSGALIAESYSGLTDVSKIDMEFDDATGKFKGAKDELIPLWTDMTGEDQKVTETIKKFSVSVNKEMDMPLGSSEADLGFDADGLNSPIGNWMTDAMRRQAGTDMAFQNTAGIRSDMKKGVLKMRDIYQVMPFENTLVTLKMTGAQLHKLIAYNLSGGKAKMQMSGLTAKFSLSPEGKITDLILERDGKVITPESEFTVVTNNYLTSGGSGGRAFNEGSNITDTALPVRDFLIKDIHETSPLKLPSGPRFIKLGN
ncbi:MAG: bifunctional UDP-sugar hydrolase/5'-nucleotidase [Elusimicrobiota bacterium]